MRQAQRHAVLASGRKVAIVLVGLAATLSVFGSGRVEPRQQPLGFPDSPLPVAVDFKLPSDPAQSSTETASDPIIDVCLDDFEFDVDGQRHFDCCSLPKGLLSVVGKRVRLRGYMFPTFQQHHLERFVLGAETRSTKRIRLGTPPLNLVVIVHLAADAKASFSMNGVSVEGWLTLEELRSDGEVRCVLKLENSRVYPSRPRDGFFSPIWNGC